MALSLTGDSTLYAVLANHTALLGISLGAVGVMLGVNRLIRVPGNLLAGALNDHLGLGRRPLFLLGLLLGIVSTLSYGLVRGFWPLLAGRLLWGIAWTLINVTGYTMVLDWSTPADRGRMAGFYQMAFMFGLALSPALGGVLTDSLGFRPALQVCAAISGAGLMVALVALPETCPPTRGLGLRFWDTAGRQRLLDLAGSWRANALDRPVLLAGVVYLVALFVSSGVLVSTIGLYVGQRWEAGVSLNGVAIGVASLSGLMLAIRALSGMIAGPLAGVWSDRLPDRWPVVRAGVLLGVVGFLVLALVVSILAVPAGVILVAISASALMTCIAALVGDLARGRRPGSTMGGLATAGDIGSAAGSFAAYALVLVLDLRWIYLLCALALASVLLATLGQSDSAGAASGKASARSGRASSRQDPAG